jgi:general secretion pathway protein F
MRYAIRAVGAEGIVTRVIEASDEHDVRHRLAAECLRPLSVAPARAGRLARRSHFSLPLFSQELLALLEAGLTLTEGIEALTDKESRAETRQVLADLLAALREGRTFSAALECQPEHFPALFVGLMRAAEHTSSLPVSLARYIEYRGQFDAVRSRAASALIYPAILAVVGFAVTAFLLGYVVPKFAGVYQGTGRELPWLSQQLIAWGRLTAVHGTGMLAGAAALAALAHVASARWRASGGPGRLLRALPLVGPTLRIFELARLYLALGTLLEGGLSITQALGLAEGLVPAPMKAGYGAAAAAIARGESVSAAFGHNGLATPVALRLIKVGERSGQLGEMLARTARFHDSEIGRRLDAFTRSFEPLLMAAIGLVVGTIVVLLYMPIFDLAGSLQ